MGPRGWRLQRWAGAAVLTGIVAMGAAASAQDDFDDDKEVEVANAAGIMFIQQQQPGVDQFDQWVFNRMGGAGIARNRLNAALDLHIDEINRVCGINDTQKRKLQLAGRGDIKRFFDRVDEAKRRYVRVMNDQNHNIWEDVQPLQAALNTGIFTQDSIFAKAVKNTLTSEQSAVLSRQEQERIKNRYLITIDWFIAHVDKGLGLTVEQRRRLADLLRTTRPPRRFASSDYYYLMYRAAQIDEEKIKPIFDDIQWRIFSMQLNQARGMQQWLKTNGAIDDEPAEDRRARNLAAARKAAPKAMIKANAKQAEVKKGEATSEKE
jgi:hypothetical protein